MNNSNTVELVTYEDFRTPVSRVDYIVFLRLETS